MKLLWRNNTGSNGEFLINAAPAPGREISPDGRAPGGEHLVVGDVSHKSLGQITK